MVSGISLGMKKKSRENDIEIQIIPLQLCVCKTATDKTDEAVTEICHTFLGNLLLNWLWRWQLHFTSSYKFSMSLYTLQCSSGFKYWPLNSHILFSCQWGSIVSYRLSKNIYKTVEYCLLLFLSRFVELFQGCLSLGIMHHEHDSGPTWAAFRHAPAS